MNIAYISTDFGVPIFGFKGASIHVREMVAALRRAGHCVSILSPAVEALQDDATADVLAVPPAADHLRLQEELKGLDTFLGMHTRVRQELRNLLYNRTFYETALPYLQARRVQVIYERYALFSYAGIRLARTLGVPHLLEVNAPLAYEQEKTRGLEMKELARETERRIFCATDQVLSVSRRLSEYVASCGVSEARLHLLPNAVDPSRFAAADDGIGVRARYHLDGKCVIGFVGSLKPWHGTETLFEAFQTLQATVDRAHLLIVGDGPGRHELEAYTLTHGLQAAVTFTGNVAYDQIPPHLAAMDITVAPYTPNDNFYYSPIKIFEYMAMGKPVVAGRIGQVEDVIVDGATGLLFEPGNVSQLAATLARLAADRGLCTRLGRQARDWVQTEHTWDRNAQQVMDVVRHLYDQHDYAPHSARTSLHV